MQRSHFEKTLKPSTIFFKTWYLKMNTFKTVSTLFHLNNREANQTLNLRINEQTLLPEPFPKYLGVTLDRSLTYKKHTENVAQKRAESTSSVNW